MKRPKPLLHPVESSQSPNRPSFCDAGANVIVPAWRERFQVVSGRSFQAAAEGLSKSLHGELNAATRLKKMPALFTTRSG